MSSLDNIWYATTCNIGPDITTRQLSVSTSVSKEPKELCIENLVDLIFSYLRINSINNKFSDLQQVISGSVSILTIAETKIYSSFLTVKFHLANYHRSYRPDISDKSGGIFVYIKSNIPTRQLYCANLCKSTQAIPFKINLRKEKWLAISIYWHLTKQWLLNSLTKIIDPFTKHFNNYIIIGNFNLEPSNTTLKHFLDSNELYNFIKGNTCFKGKGSLIDLILTKRNKFRHLLKLVLVIIDI